MSADIEPFYAMEINRLAYQLQGEGRSIVHMEYGQPSAGAPKTAIAVTHHILDTDPMGYWISPELKEGLARHYKTSYGLDIDPERFVLTCGASPALVLALAVRFAAGDTVATARPGYVAYRNTLKALHLNVREIACGPETRYQLAASHLETGAPPAGIIVASPANPTGTIIPAEELEKIAAVCRKRNIAVVSDEIYHGISYVGPAQSMLRFDPDAFVVGSFSKFFGMPAWRMGWLLAPPAYAQRAQAFMSNLFLSAPSLSQHAAIAALECRDELEARVEIYRRNRALLLQALPRMGLDRIAPPDGAFYFYADVRHLTDDSLAFCKRLLQETGVAAAPGIDFDPVDGRHFVRFSFALSTAETEDAIARLEPWFAAQSRR